MPALSKSRTFTLTQLGAAFAAILVAWGLSYLQNGLAYGQWDFGPASAVLALLLCCAVWIVVEEPELAPGAPAKLGRMLAAFLLIGLGEALLYPLAQGKDTWAALGFTGLGAGAALLWPVGNKTARGLAWLAVAGLAGLGIYMVWQRQAVVWDIFGPATQNTPWFWCFLVLAMAGLAWGAATAKPTPSPQEAPLPRIQELGLLALIVAIAACLRFYKAAAIPQGWWYDEIILARDTRGLLWNRQQGAPLFVLQDLDNPGAYLWMGAALFRFFGAGVAVLRMADAAFGLLALLAFWGLARRWMGPRWALAASLAFGVMHWVLIHERIAFMSGFALFWMLASFWALWSAQARGGVWPWLLAGLLLGANLHIYIPGRLVPPFVFVFLGLQAWLDRDWRRSWPEWGAFLVGFLLIGGPMLWWTWAHWDLYVARIRTVAIFALTPSQGLASYWDLLRSFGKHALMFQFRGDANSRHNVHFFPQVDGIMACGLALAFPWTLGRVWKDARARFLWLWLAVMLAAAALSLAWEAPQGHRSILASPALPLALGVALSELLAPLKSSFVRGWPGTGKAMAAAALLGLLWLNAWNVFGVWAQSQDTYRSFSPRASAMARRLQGLDPGTAVYLSSLKQESAYAGMEWRQFASFVLSQQAMDYQPLLFSQQVPAAIAHVPVKKVLLVWVDSDKELDRSFRAEFPGINPEVGVQEFPGPGEPEVQYYAAEIRVDDVPLRSKQRNPPIIYR
jgi:hypothetical protein